MVLAFHSSSQLVMPDANDFFWETFDECVCCSHSTEVAWADLIIFNLTDRCGKNESIFDEIIFEFERERR